MRLPACWPAVIAQCLLFLVPGVLSAQTVRNPKSSPERILYVEPVPPIRVNVWRDEDAQDWSVEIIQDVVAGSPQELPLALIEDMVAEALLDADIDSQQS